MGKELLRKMFEEKTHLFYDNDLKFLTEEYSSKRGYKYVRFNHFVLILKNRFSLIKGWSSFITQNQLVFGVNQITQSQYSVELVFKSGKNSEILTVVIEENLLTMIFF